MIIMIIMINDNNDNNDNNNNKLSAYLLNHIVFEEEWVEVGVHVKDAQNCYNLFGICFHIHFCHIEAYLWQL